MSIQRLVLASALTVLAILGSACGPPNIIAGEVIGRDFIPAHTKVWNHEHTRQQCGYEYGYNGMTGKYEMHNKCQQLHDYWHTHEDYYPDKWTVTIRGCVHWDKKVFKDEEHCDSSTHVVSNDTYRKLEGAKWYNVKTGEISRSGDFN